ncbi:MAG: endopeptidase La [bacterium]|nr:endopeptidase La [bacterium]
MEETKMVMPTVALRGLTVLPKMMIHFDVNRPQSVAAIERAMVSDQKVFLVAQKDAEESAISMDNLYRIGCIARVVQVAKLPHNTSRVMVEGLSRAELKEVKEENPCLVAEIELCGPVVQDVDSVTGEAMLQILKDKTQTYINENMRQAEREDILAKLLLTKNLSDFLERMMQQFPFHYTHRQRIMELDTVSEQYEYLVSVLVTEIEVGRVRREFQEKVKESVDKNQKEYILREQLKVIRKELGEDNTLEDADEYRKKVQELQAKQEVKDRLNKEIDRFKGMPATSPESNVLRTYIETLLELPWDKESTDYEDIHRAEEILNEDHYGLKKVKDRILEYLAVRILSKKGSSSILCLVGPPGTGKTSIARSVARALNKEYVRISLGGVRDEAEIRGHRKTYVGAMPGRLVEGLRQAGVSNPLMLLDEIDKVSSDYKGDTSSALLEVLDSEQNMHFRDHYVELPIDLSRVFFIATANDMQTIPRPLLDRMEIIEINSYTENEKLHIAKDYLVEKQKKRNGIAQKQLVFSNRALEKMIRYYTREAGVRGLERTIGDVCRKAAREFLEGRTSAVRITEANLSKYLGKEKVHFESANAENQVGIVRGLAWTSVGGDTLEIEVNSMPGKGKMLLTGQMGDVMKESAQIALTYVRSVCPEYQVDANYFETHDLHIHIPAGAVPKDGPSAGITMATAMLSAVTGRKVDARVAMTGEVTLRGRVLPIGGLKEKVLAAKKAQVKKVLVPVENRPDIVELSDEITKGLQIVYVKEMKDVLAEAFGAEEAAESEKLTAKEQQSGEKEQTGEKHPACAKEQADGSRE